MTTKIKKIDRPSCRLINDGINENLAEFLEEYGLKMSTSRGTFDSTTFNIKLTFHPENMNPEKDEFEMWAKTYGLEPSDYGREIEVGGWRSKPGGTFRLVAINTRAPKFPFECIGVDDGRRYKFTSAAIMTALGRKPEPIESRLTLTDPPASSKKGGKR